MGALLSFVTVFFNLVPFSILFRRAPRPLDEGGGWLTAGGGGAPIGGGGGGPMPNIFESRGVHEANTEISFSLPSTVRELYLSSCATGKSFYLCLCIAIGCIKCNLPNGRLSLIL